jgi:hypothetical protein
MSEQGQTQEPKPQPQPQAAPGGGSKRGAIMAWLIAPMIGVVFFPTIILLTIGMAPALVAFMTDRRAGKFAARSVAYLNFAGCLPFALRMWVGDHTIDAAFQILSDPMSWFVMYSAAAVGWLIYFCTPPIVAGYMAVTHEVKVQALDARQEALIKEWGAEVKGIEASPPPPAPSMDENDLEAPPPPPPEGEDESDLPPPPG